MYLFYFLRHILELKQCEKSQLIHFPIAWARTTYCSKCEALYVSAQLINVGNALCCVIRHLLSKGTSLNVGFSYLVANGNITSRVF